MDGWTWIGWSTGYLAGWAVGLWDARAASSRPPQPQCLGLDGEPRSLDGMVRAVWVPVGSRFLWVDGMGYGIDPADRAALHRLSAFSSFQNMF